MKVFSTMILLVLLAFTGLRVSATAPDSAGIEFFEKKIRPVLAEHCYECHSHQTKKLKADLYLDNREGLLQGGESGVAVVLGDPDKSRLIEAIRYSNPDLQMPPKKKLPATAIADLVEWIKMGAPWPVEAKPKLAEANKDDGETERRRREHWAWQPIRDFKPPAVKKVDWPRGPIDQFILAKLEEKGLNGGPSQVDTFDPKPALARYEGQTPEAIQTKTGRRKRGGLMSSPFKWSKYGQSGIEVTELYPEVAGCIDDLCVIRSMHTDNPNHEPALLMMNSGNQQPIRPSLGSWITYGLGTDNQNLPGFVALCPGKPVVGPQLWGNSFLPGIFQGTHINNKEVDPKKIIRNLENRYLSQSAQREQLDLLQQMNQLHLEKREQDPQLESRISALELAFRMQFEAQDAFDIGKESEATRKMYGEGEFANACLIARRLAERGVRITQIYYGNAQPWDDHADINNHRDHARKSDKPIAALLKDLKSRGLLQDTLVIWGGEFGRTPYAEGAKGRDHHSIGFTMWLAGGGIKGGMVYGATDEFGYQAIENRVHVHDLHATILHLMGLDHTRLTYRYSGRDFRLTDVHGEVVKGILA